MSREATRKDALEYYALTSVLGGLRKLPLARARGVGMGLAALMARVAPIRRHRALLNIAMAFPGMPREQCQQVYLGMMRNLGRMLGDFAHLPRYSSQTILDMFPIEGGEHLTALLHDRRGAVLITGHYGNWELLGASAHAMGLPMVFFGARQRNPYVEQLFNSYRTARESAAVSLGDGLRPLVKQLKAGNLLATLADQDGGRNGMFMDFLGTQASVRPGVFRLMARLDAPMITGFSHWDGMRWRGRIEPAVDPKDLSGDVDAKARQLAAVYNRKLEEAIRARPDHWFWLHHRWRSRPRAPVD